MNVSQLFKVIIFFGLLLSLHSVAANVVLPKSIQEPIKVTPCQLAENPGEYNHKLVQVTGFVSHGFEDFTIFDPTCSSRFSIWLEYGGVRDSDTMYCCGVTPSNSRPKQLVVESIPIPLTDDARFRQFNALVQKRPSSTVHATLVGRFFSGKQQQSPNGVFWGGFGHLGCCSLLAIQQILEVDTQRRSDLDYESSVDQPNANRVGCGYSFLEPDQNPIEIQRQAELGQQEWRFTAPQRVASETLAKLLNIKEESISGLRATRKIQGRIVYQWRPKARQKSYMIVVNRPYWLSFYAKDNEKIVWVVAAAYESSCDSNNSVQRIR
ncbi:MAG: hypothetical protein JNK38_19575 [Acidobacteria bacterium]|nr:hypothetical protein [Acidobacteriota bacterium]